MAVACVYYDLDSITPNSSVLNEPGIEFDQPSSGSLTTPDNIIYLRGGPSDIIAIFKQESPQQVTLAAAGQIAFLHHKLGFNITEISQILFVKRPTIYEWLDGKEPSKRNQHRLDAVYQSCLFWGETGLTGMGSYLHKSIIGSLSLFDLLSAAELRVDLIEQTLHKIATLLLSKKQQQQEFEKFLQEQGFKHPTKEERRKAIKEMSFSIS